MNETPRRPPETPTCCVELGTGPEKLLRWWQQGTGRGCPYTDAGVAHTCIEEEAHAAVER